MIEGVTGAPLALAPEAIEEATGGGLLAAQGFGWTILASCCACLAVALLTRGGVDHAIEAIGLKVTAEQAFGMLRNGGSAIVIGMIPPGHKVALHGVDFLFEKSIQGSFMGSNRFRVDMPRFVELYLQGKLHLDDLVSSRIKLADVNDALKALETGEIARNVIMFEH